MQLRTFLLGLLAWLAALPAAAHDVFPTAITLRPGGEDFFCVADQGACPATITAKSSVPSLVEVAAVNMTTGSVGSFGAQATVQNRIDQVFQVRARPGVSGPANAVIEVCWIGSTAPNPPCSENNCSPYAPHFVFVTVAADPLSVANSVSAGVVGDPISTDDGELFFAEDADLDLGGPLPLRFERFYSSRLSSDGNASSTLGPNWLSNFDWRILSSGSNVEVLTAGGRVLRFQRGAFSTIWTLAVYQDVPFQLVDSGANRLLLDPTSGIVRTFDPTGRLVQVSDGRGSAHALAYASGRLASVSDGLGRTLTLGYSGGGQLVSVGDGTRTVTFGYTGTQLTSATDAAGKTTTYAYPAAAAPMTSRTRPEGNVPYVHAFDASRRATSETDAFANTTLLSYDAVSGETTITDPLGNDVVHDHVGGARLGGFVDEGGSAAALAHDSKGRRTSVTDRLGRTTSWTFHAASGQLASITEADGATTSYGYTARSSGGLAFHDLTSITYPGGESESFTYDASGNMLTCVDRAGGTWTFTYNARGQMLTATDPGGAVTTLAYNADGTVASSTDAESRITSYAYDALRRVLQVTRPDATTVGFAYDALDRVISVTDEEGRTTAYGHDDNGNLVTITDAASRVWQLGYDALDRLETVTDPEGNVSTAAFDERGLLESLSNGGGELTTFAHGARGYLGGIADGLGHAWTLATDSEGVTLSLDDPAGRTTSFASDFRGRLTRSTTPLGRETSLVYDAFGRVTRVTDPLGRAAVLTRDARGELGSLSLPAAGTVTATRDPAGDVASLQYPGGATWQYARDASGLLTAITDPLGRATTVTRDGRGRVSGITLPGGMGTATLTWSDAGRLTDVDLSDGTALDYGYDAVGRLVSAGAATFGWDDAGRMIDSDGIAIGRDGVGRIASVTYAPGKVVTYAYDARGLLATVTDWLGGVTSFTYDSAARLVAIARPNGLTTRYTFDEDSRLVRIADVQDALQGELERASIAITHLDNDTIASIDVTPVLTALPQLGSSQRSFDAAGQLAGAQHDARGQRLVDGQSTYTWDLAGRLTDATIGGEAYALDWDALNQVDVITGPSSAIYGRNYAAGAIAIVLKNDQAQDTSYVVTTPAGGVLHTIDASTDARAYYHYDARFSTQYLSDDSGAFTDRYQYGPLGDVLDHAGSSTQPFTYLGHYGVQQLGTTPVYLRGSWIYDSASGLTLNPDWTRPADPRAASPYATFGTELRPFTLGSTVSALPRFADLPSGVDGFSNPALRSNLLAPFVGNSTGFDGGLAIDLSFGVDFRRPGTPKAPQAADALDWTQGLNAHAAGKSGFTIAHGYVFITDPASARMASGYLSLIMGDGSDPTQSPSAAIDPDENRRKVIAKFRARFPVRPNRAPAAMFASHLAQFRLYVAAVQLVYFCETLDMLKAGGAGQSPLLAQYARTALAAGMIRTAAARPVNAWPLTEYWMSTMFLLLWYRTQMSSEWLSAREH